MKYILIFACAFAALSCEGPVGPPGPASGPGSLSDPAVMPKVIYSYPGNMTVGPFSELYRYECGWEWCYSYSQFQVRFNKFMDVGSVRRSVRLTSPLGEIRADTNFIMSVGGDVFILNPVDSNGYRSAFRFRIGAAYAMGVDSSARDINGNPLIPPFSASFIPEPYFRVMNSDPKNGAVDVPTYFYSALQFNSNVTREIIPHIAINPPVAGVWGLGYDSSRLSFSPASNLKAATEYTITVDETAEDVAGNRLPGPATVRFTTVPFRVNASYPPNGSTGVSLTVSPSVYFTVPLDTSTIRSAYHMAPPTVVTLDGVYPGTTGLSVRPRDGLLASTIYTISFDTTLTSVGGDRLPGQFSISFTTAAFAIVQAYPQDGATNVPRTYMIGCYVNAPIDYSTLPASIQLNPPAAIGINGCDGCSSFQFWAQSGLAANTTYTVTIGTSLKTKRGQALQAPYNFSFTTGPD